MQLLNKDINILFIGPYNVYREYYMKYFNDYNIY